MPGDPAPRAPAPGEPRPCPPVRRRHATPRVLWSASQRPCCHSVGHRPANTWGPGGLPEEDDRGSRRSNPSRSEARASPVGGIVPAAAEPADPVDAPLWSAVVTPTATATAMANTDTTTPAPHRGPCPGARTDDPFGAATTTAGAARATVAELVAIKAATRIAEPVLGSATHDHVTRAVLGMTAAAGKRRPHAAGFPKTMRAATAAMPANKAPSTTIPGEACKGSWNNDRSPLAPRRSARKTRNVVAVGRPTLVRAAPTSTSPPEPPSRRRSPPPAAPVPGAASRFPVPRTPLPRSSVSLGRAGPAPSARHHPAQGAAPDKGRGHEDALTPQAARTGSRCQLPDATTRRRHRTTTLAQRRSAAEVSAHR